MTVTENGTPDPFSRSAPATTPADGDLKPCPFCGGDPEMVQHTKVNWSVMCHVCGAEGGWGNPSAAIAVWNARATPSPVATRTVPEGIVLEAIRDELGEELFDMQSGATWLRAVYAAILVAATPSPGKADAEMLKDKARLDSGVIMTSERDEFGEEYTCERRGLDLRAMIDAAMQAQERDKQ